MRVRTSKICKTAKNMCGKCVSHWRVPFCCHIVFGTECIPQENCSYGEGLKVNWPDGIPPTVITLTPEILVECLVPSNQSCWCYLHHEPETHLPLLELVLGYLNKHKTVVNCSSAMYMLFNDQLLTSSNGSGFYNDDISYDFRDTDT